MGGIGPPLPLYKPTLTFYPGAGFGAAPPPTWWVALPSPVLVGEEEEEEERGRPGLRAWGSGGGEGGACCSEKTGVICRLHIWTRRPRGSASATATRQHTGRAAPRGRGVGQSAKLRAAPPAPAPGQGRGPRRPATGGAGRAAGRRRLREPWGRVCVILTAAVPEPPRGDIPVAADTNTKCGASHGAASSGLTHTLDLLKIIGSADNSCPLSPEEKTKAERKELLRNTRCSCSSVTQTDLSKTLTQSPQKEPRFSAKIQ